MSATNIIVLSLQGGSFTLQHSPIISCLCDKTRHYAAQNNRHTTPLQPDPSTQHSLQIHLPQLSTGDSPTFASTEHLESRCAPRLRYVDLVQTCIDARGHRFQQLSERRSAESVCK
jgi:hypothetical protein